MPRNPGDSSRTQAAGPSERQVIDFLRQTLGIIKSELEHSLSLQGEMAERISQHTIALVTKSPEQCANDATAILTALQSDDRIRQRHEGLIAVVNTLVEVIQETADDATSDPCVALNVGDASRQRWIARILASQSLEELETSFARELTTD